MIRDGSNESGWTLIELLVAMTLMLIVLSATLTSFNAFSNTSKRNFDFNDQQDQVRNTMDQIVRQARNLANPTTGNAGVSVPTIAFASKDQLVFQTTDPTKQWVRYCLNTNKLGSTTANNYTDQAVGAGSQYVYAVTAINGAGEETRYSNQIAVTLPASVPVPAPAPAPHQPGGRPSRPARRRRTHPPGAACPPWEALRRPAEPGARPQPG